MTKAELEEIRERLENGYVDAPIPAQADDISALLAEVERLREERFRLQMVIIDQAEFTKEQRDVLIEELKP
jgi:hypothetical protein